MDRWAELRGNPVPNIGYWKVSLLHVIRNNTPLHLVENLQPIKEDATCLNFLHELKSSQSQCLIALTKIPLFAEDHCSSIDTSQSS